MGDTIFALASGSGKAGVAVVRLSGPRAWEVVQTLAGRVPGVRRLTLCDLRDGEDLLDQALVVVFAEGASFTGEAAAELHLHGSRAVVSAVLTRLGRFDGLRLAQPGEFTRRALENGAVDLVQVEGLGDLIEAETEAQRKQALRVFSGALGDKVAIWRTDLVRAAALMEATIDFADEDVPVDVLPEVETILQSVVRGLEAELAGADAARQVREGFEVAIVGAPNAGKSTLLNRLAGREAAITSSVAGTTRDVIEVRMDIAGQAVTLLDTAGIRESGDEIERIGVARGLQRASQADLRIVLQTGEALPGIAVQEGDIALRAKCDDADQAADGIGVSGLTGAGVDWLVSEIGRRVGNTASGAGLLVRVRQQEAARRGLSALRDAALAIGSGQPVELVAEDVRSAVRALDFLIGRVDVEDVLGDVFARFCIGK